MNDDLYQEIILDHYKHPRNKGKQLTSTPSSKVMSSKAANVSCGDHLDIKLLVQDNHITDVSWTGDGCAISQASMSLVSEWMIGKTLKEVHSLTQQDILSLTGIESITPTRETCLFLSKEALSHVGEDH